MSYALVNHEFFYVHMTVHCNKLLFNKTNRRTRFQIYSGTKLHMFRVVPPLLFCTHTDTNVYIYSRYIVPLTMYSNLMMAS